MKQTVFHTSLGWAGVAVTDHGICKVVLPQREKSVVERELTKAASGTTGCAEKTAAGLILEKALSQLHDYFSGNRVSFDLPLDMRDATSFQQSVWKAVAAIPYGETRSYGWIAKKLGRPHAARAVGQAMGANPLPVVIP